MRNKVAFIAHPLDLKSLSTISGIPFRVLKFFKKEIIKNQLFKKKPFIFFKQDNLISKSGDSVDFIAVACPLLPDQMVALDKKIVINKIIESISIAKENGADIVVLGGFTSVIGGEGDDVVGAVDIAVTNGNTYTAALAIQGVIKAVKILNRDLHDCNLTILGATGDIGSVCAKFFYGRVNKLILCARDRSRLEKFQAEFLPLSQIARDLAPAISNADIIISATSALTTIIDPHLLRQGAIVCDVSLPANISKELSSQKSDALIFEGGLCKLPFDNLRGGKWKKLLPATTAVYGCLSEGLILGFEGLKTNFSIGRGNITLERIDQISKLATKHGFELSNFFCGRRFYSEVDIQSIKSGVREGSNVQS